MCHFHQRTQAGMHRPLQLFEANRQKATVQIKVKVQKPDDHLRPEMNASVAFLADEKPAARSDPAHPIVMAPATAVRNGAVFFAQFVKCVAALDVAGKIVR